MRKIIYRLFGNPISRDLGIRGTNSGKLYIDKKVFFKRKDVQKNIKKIKHSIKK